MKFTVSCVAVEFNRAGPTTSHTARVIMCLPFVASKSVWKRGRKKRNIGCKGGEFKMIFLVKYVRI